MVHIKNFPTLTYDFGGIADGVSYAAGIAADATAPKLTLEDVFTGYIANLASRRDPDNNNRYVFADHNAIIDFIKDPASKKDLQDRFFNAGYVGLRQPKQQDIENLLGNYYVRKRIVNSIIDARDTDSDAKIDDIKMNNAIRDNANKIADNITSNYPGMYDRVSKLAKNIYYPAHESAKKAKIGLATAATVAAGVISSPIGALNALGHVIEDEKLKQYKNVKEAFLSPVDSVMDKTASITGLNKLERKKSGYNEVYEILLGNLSSLFPNSMRYKSADGLNINNLEGIKLSDGDYINFKHYKDDKQNSIFSFETFNSENKLIHKSNLLFKNKSKKVYYNGKSIEKKEDLIYLNKNLENLALAQDKYDSLVPEAIDKLLNLSARDNIEFSDKKEIAYKVKKGEIGGVDLEGRKIKSGDYLKIKSYQDQKGNSNFVFETFSFAEGKELKLINRTNIVYDKENRVVLQNGKVIDNEVFQDLNNKLSYFIETKNNQKFNIINEKPADFIDDKVDIIKALNTKASQLKGYGDKGNLQETVKKQETKKYLSNGGIDKAKLISQGFEIIENATWKNEDFSSLQGKVVFVGNKFQDCNIQIKEKSEFRFVDCVFDKGCKLPTKKDGKIDFEYIKRNFVTPQFNKEFLEELPLEDRLKIISLTGPNTTVKTTQTMRKTIDISNSGRD